MELVHELICDLFSEKQVRVFILRIDLLHPLMGGNKHFKLKYNIEEAKRQGKDTLLSFGGAYSNHIAALAAAGKEHSIRTIGVIRGNELDSESNPTLKLARQNGMEFYFVDREEYRHKTENYFIEDLKNKFGDFYIVPEGGSNAFAIKGCMEIKNFIPFDFEAIVCASGTGGTIAGISLSLLSHQKAVGIPVLKGADFLYNEIECLQKEYAKEFNLSERIVIPDLQMNYHFGGYAKMTDELKNFKLFFEREFQKPLDKIYTAKMMYALFDLVKKNYFKPNMTIVAVHTGGLQGD